MYRHNNKYKSCICTPPNEEKEYARAYIMPQKYENLFTCKEAFCKGTIFKDLYSPYKEKKNDYC